MSCGPNSLCGDIDGKCTGICQSPGDRCVQFTNGKFGCSRPTNYFLYVAFGVAGLVVFLFLILIIVASFTRSRSYSYDTGTAIPSDIPPLYTYMPSEQLREQLRAEQLRAAQGYFPPDVMQAISPPPDPYAQSAYGF